MLLFYCFERREFQYLGDVFELCTKKNTLFFYANAKRKENWDNIVNQSNGSSSHCDLFQNKTCLTSGKPSKKRR